MKRLSTVERLEYWEFLRCHLLKMHPTEGHDVAASQWLDKEGTVRAQAFYQKIGGTVSVSYEIDKKWENNGEQLN